MSINFGWLLPYARERMPDGGSDQYLPHILHMLDHVRPHFHGLWVADHFMNDAADIPEAMTTLSFLAGLEPRLHMGALVLGQNYRNPALLAKMAATLQQLSGGRFIMGIGAGWKEDEYRAYGYEFPPTPVRIAQLAEAIQICRAMWYPAQPQATFHGKHYHIEKAVCNPKPTPPPPILVGGGGEKLTLRVVAEHADWWNLPGVSPEEYARKIEVLARHCEAVGRDPASIRKSWKGVVSIAPTRRQAEAQMADYPIWPGDIPLVGTPADIRAQIERYVEVGVDYFMLAFADEPAHDGIDLFTTEVIAPASSLTPTSRGQKAFGTTNNTKSTEEEA